MAKGVSLHLGVNHVDPGAYPAGWDSRLKRPETDANDLAALAGARGFRTTTLLTSEVTADRVLAEIAGAARRLARGDFFLLTYSGHGGRMPDANGDDADRLDETWALYDRQLYDDEVHVALRAFAPGVRVVVISDSCHSGTVASMLALPDEDDGLIRAMPDDVALADLEARRRLYDRVTSSLRAQESVQEDVQASVILLSACADDELSKEGPRNGVFTGLFLRRIDGGRFQGNYENLRDAIAERSPSWQTPQLTTYGTGVSAFLGQRPLTI